MLTKQLGDADCQIALLTNDLEGKGMGSSFKTLFVEAWSLLIYYVITNT